MRLREFTNAEEQLGLLKQVNDCAWRAIADQAAAQKKERELKQVKAASKPRSKRASAPVRAKSTLAKSAAPAPVKNAQTNAQNKSSAVSNLIKTSAVDDATYKNDRVAIRPYAGYGARKAYGVTG
jgi:hypothetical protein